METRPFAGVNSIPVAMAKATFVLAVLAFAAAPLVSQKRNPDGGVQYQLKRAERLMDQLNFRFAVEHLKRAEKNYPESAMLKVLRGECYFSLDHLGDAIEAYEAGFKLQPLLKARVGNYPYCFYKLGRLDEAEKAYRHITEQGPQPKYRSQGHYGLGICALAKDDLKTAESEFRKALKLTPQSIKTNYRLGVLARRDGRLDEAIKRLELCVERNGLHEAALMQLALAHARKKNREKAEYYKKRHLEVRSVRERLGGLRSALAKNPNNLEALSGVADIYFRFGNYGAAIGPYKTLVVAKAKDVEIRYRLAVCLRHTGELHPARLQAQRILRESPGHVKATELHDSLMMEVYGPDGKPDTGDEVKPEKP